MREQTKRKQKVWEEENRPVKLQKQRPRLNGNEGNRNYNGRTERKHEKTKIIKKE
jgi:hypothetical protein